MRNANITYLENQNNQLSNQAASGDMSAKSKRNKVHNTMVNPEELEMIENENKYRWYRP